MPSKKRPARAAALKTVAIRPESADPVLAFAVRELTWMLEAATSFQIIPGAGSADLTLCLKTSAKLPAAAFEIRVRTSGAKRVVDLVGRPPAAALHAAYTLLERAAPASTSPGRSFPRN